MFASLIRSQTLLLVLLLVALPVSADGLMFEPCQVQKGAVSVDGECAILRRLENPDDQDSQHIELQVVKFRARTPEPAADAFTVIQGGPGMSSIDLYLSMRGIFSLIQAKRDILVLDQRGTGRSNGLFCDLDDDLDLTVFDPAQTKQMAQDCLNQIESDVRYYTTSIAVQDLEAMRDAAGYEQLSIYGVSYGTRVAQHYLRQYPQHTRAVILDGVADVELNLAGSEIAVRSQQAFDGMVARCAGDEACSERYGNLDETFQELRALLQDEPQTVRLPHPVSGEMVEETITEQHLLSLVRLMPYATESLALLPYLLHTAKSGNLTPLAAQALLVEETFNNDYSLAMNNSVICAEDAPFLTEQDIQGHENTYFGSNMSDSMQAVCEVWPKGPVDDGFKRRFQSDVPALLLSGETDPITPPENAERAVEMFSDAQHITVPDHGHGVIGRGCLPQLASEFIEAASTQNLDASCVQRERAMPFFISPAGPTP